MSEAIEPLFWEIYELPPLGHRIWINAEVAKDFVRIHVPHCYIMKNDEDKIEEYDGEIYFQMRSMTGQICTLVFEKHRGVVRCEYSYVVAVDRLDYDRIFYPNQEGTNVKDAKKYIRKTAVRLMKRFWKDHQHGLCDGTEKFKELQKFIDRCFEVMENE